MHISLKAEKIFDFFSFPITNTTIVSFVILFLFLVFGFLFKKRLFIYPSRLQGLVEYIFEGVIKLMSDLLDSRDKAIKYFPLIFTIFIFVLFSNWFGLLPGVGSIILKEHYETKPLFRAPSSDLNFTLALALISVLATNFIGLSVLGIANHLKKYFNFQNPISFFVGLLELISELAKIISFSFRLFGNIFAGEVLLVIVGFLVPYFIPMPFIFLEIFVGFIQAFVFAMLTLVFISIHTKHSH